MAEQVDQLVGDGVAGDGVAATSVGDGNGGDGNGGDGSGSGQPLLAVSNYDPVRPPSVLAGSNVWKSKSPLPDKLNKTLPRVDYRDVTSLADAVTHLENFMPDTEKIGRDVTAIAIGFTDRVKILKERLDRITTGLGKRKE